MRSVYFVYRQALVGGYQRSWMHLCWVYWRWLHRRSAVVQALTKDSCAGRVC